jgi:hypothetical protein
MTERMKIEDLKTEDILFGPVNLVGCKAKSFPEGISEAWNELESQLPTKSGRKFYGLTIPVHSQIEYYACVIPQKNESLNGKWFQIERGKFARVKLLNWKQHTDKISVIIDQLIQVYHPDMKAISLEYYKSEKELHLLVPKKMI